MAQQQPSQLDLIKTLLNNDFIDNSKVLQEKEKDHNGNAFVMRRQIVCHREIEYILFRFDPNKTKLFPYFADVPGLQKICDYLLFAEEGNYLHLILIELKKGKDSAYKQLNAAQCFADFIIASGKRIGLPFTKHLIIHKVRVSEERAKKRNRSTKNKPLEIDQNGIINYDHSDVFRINEVLEIG